MPKMKTHKGIAKRFSLTASGRVKYKHAHLRHCLTHKTKVAKNRLQKTGFLSGKEAATIAAALN